MVARPRPAARDFTLLTTKLYIPPARPNLVPRPRLIERLDEALRLGRKLTLISAPAGFGKTTLLSEWAHSKSASAPCVGWISLDEGDNDPARFWAYFFAMLQTIPVFSESDVASAALAALEGPQLPLIESVLTDLINKIVAVSHGDDQSHPSLLILDDYHVITAETIHEGLTFLLDHLPGNMHLVIATRADPPLPVARLRGRGQVTELRFTDLRFTVDEATEFLNQAMRLELSADNVAALASRTEGWIAGLQIAAASVQGRDDVPRVIHAFTGSDRNILDYLVEEVLARQPDHIQAFLLQTSILDQLCGPLCDAILSDVTTGQPGLAAPSVSAPASGREILESLDKANMFLVPLDNRREWYRYHRLFADLLSQLLNQEQPGRVPTLHRRASAWYEQRATSLGDDSLLIPAIHHALAGHDFEQAARLIEGIAEATLMRSEVPTFLRWVEALPDDLVRARPSLCVYHAWALFLIGGPLQAVESHLDDLDQDASLISGKATPLRAFIAAFQGRMSDATQLSRQALEQLPEDDLFLRSIATWLLGISYRADGDLFATRQAMDEAVRMSQRAGNVLVAVLVLCHSAELHMKQGQLHKAEAIYNQALELAVDRQGQQLPVASQPLMGLGELRREWNDFEAATRYLSQGIEFGRGWRESSAIDGYLSLARIKQAQGDTEGAQGAIQAAQQLARQLDATQVDDLFVALEQARQWVAQGNLESAMGWARARRLEEDSDPAASPEGDALVNHRLRKYEHLVLARLLLAQDRPDEALALLESLLSQMQGSGRTGTVIEIVMLKALALQAQGEVEQALLSLGHALALAEPEGYVRLFVDEGPPMAELLSKMLYAQREAGAAPTRGNGREYIGKLLAAFEVPEDPAQPLIEPLSERELEILQLIADGLSNREIAQQIHLSLPTVKWHASNIYGKLAVRSRTQAVTKARVLGILPIA